MLSHEGKLFYKLTMKESTQRMQSLIHESIREKGAISYAEFMQLALYHPELGYYSAPQMRTGKAGDFFTSVSVGSCFGKILASRVLNLWQQANCPIPLHLIEAGANDGQLAKDILDELAQLCAPLATSLEYHIIEPLPIRQDIQRKTIAAYDQQVIHHAEPPSLDGDPYCIFLSNELIDAFPFHLVQRIDGTWRELFVISTDATNFSFTPREITFDHTLPDSRDEGYLTEYRTNVAPWVAALASISKKMHTIFIDYGHRFEDYYHPSRVTGTHRTYHKHEAAEFLLDRPGEQDITAHVDFTQLIKNLEHQGFTASNLISQASYLTNQGAAYLLSLEALFATQPQRAAAQIQQFKTLTTTLGHNFQVLEASRWY